MLILIQASILHKHLSKMIFYFYKKLEIKIGPTMGFFKILIQHSTIHLFEFQNSMKHKIRKFYQNGILKNNSKIDVLFWKYWFREISIRQISRKIIRYFFSLLTSNIIFVPSAPST